MAGISRSSIGRLAMSYPGHISVCKLRYGYGHQEHLEKLEILHSWYSDLNAYLPVLFKGKEAEYNKEQYKSVTSDGAEIKTSLAGLMDDVSDEIDKAYEDYKPEFDGQSCNPNERKFIKVMRGIKERLDVITAESKIIEGVKMDDLGELLAG